MSEEVTQAELDAITDDEIRVWLYAVTNITDETRPTVREGYIRNWNVRQKIVCAKRSGLFQELAKKIKWIISISDSLKTVI